MTYNLERMELLFFRMKGVTFINFYYVSRHIIYIDA
jgi:hypothetical protein